MNRQLIGLLILGFIAQTYSANVISSANDAALKGVMDKAKAGLEKLLDTAEQAAGTVRDKTIGNLKSLRSQYNTNFQGVKAQIVAASEKLRESFTQNFEIVKNTLKRNDKNIKDQIKPNFEKSLESFKNSFDQLANKIPSLKSHLETTLGDLKQRAESVFASNDKKFDALTSELEAEYQAGLKDLTV